MKAITFFVRPWFWVVAVLAWIWLCLGLSALSDSSIGYKVTFFFLK